MWTNSRRMLFCGHFLWFIVLISRTMGEPTEPANNATLIPALNPSYGINVDEFMKCINVTAKPPPNDGNLYCPATFDHWLCWDYTKAGTTAVATCPYKFKPIFSADEFAEKTCMEDGTWYVNPESNNTWTDYRMCLKPDNSRMILYMSISGYSISCVLLVISIVIFNAFRQLQCSRVVMHQHLFISFILTGVMWIVTYSQFLTKPELRKNNPAWCKVIYVLTQYASVSNYFWMFCEGFFLHTIIVQAFSKQKKLLFACYVIGWGLPILPVIAYVIARSLDTVHDILCWSEPTWTIWILSAPIVLSLVINFCLLLNILRILLSKIRAFNSAEHNQNRRAVKATLILVPLLGLQNLLTLIKPPLDDSGKFIWDMASAVLVSYQGAAVAVIFCFLNGEVLTVLKRKWSQWFHNYDSSFLGRPSNNYSTTMAMSLDDTTTGTTIFKNGSNTKVAKTSSRNAKDNTELQLMMPAEKSGKEVSFNT